jgi:hypothetical protein
VSINALKEGELKGSEQLLRLIYLDEAGISEAEPVAVVAGIVVEADRDCFHATELFSGGRTFTRQKWNRELRWTILERLLSIPKELQIPVVAGLGCSRTSVRAGQDCAPFGCPIRVTHWND